jgi:exodeoxyribonuclease V alpha subunit
MKVLGHCHRQAGALRRNCAAILQGKLMPTEKTNPLSASPWVVEDQWDDPRKAAERIVDIYTRFIPDKLGMDPQSCCQVIVPQNKDNPLSTGTLNVLLQRAWHAKNGRRVQDWGGDKPGFVVGDRVIQTRNNYDLDIMNGHQGIVINPPANGRSGPGMIVKWEGLGDPMPIPPESVGDIDLSYALTVHRMQGSEVPIVVFACHSTNWFMLNRQLLYTATTRARQAVYLIGNSKGLADAVKKIDASRRKTLLPILAQPAELFQ